MRNIGLHIDYKEDDNFGEPIENEFTMRLWAYGTVINSTKIKMDVENRDKEDPHNCRSVNDPHITTFDGL